MSQNIISYKTIYRIDYPLSFSLVDHLGKYSEIIYNIITKKPYFDHRFDLNLSQHSITALANYKDDSFRSNLSLKSLNTIIEHKNGEDILSLHNHPTLKLSDELLNNFDKKIFKDIERIGFRTWIILEGDSFKFQTIRQKLLSFNNPIQHSLKDEFNIIDDIGITFETHNENNDQCRISIGPYQSSEKAKYFSLNVDIKEGMVMDIDVWQSAFSMPNLSISNVSRHYFKLIYNIAKGLSKKLGED